jgi:hypothetical protein
MEGVSKTQERDEAMRRGRWRHWGQRVLRPERICPCKRMDSLHSCNICLTIVPHQLNQLGPMLNSGGTNFTHPSMHTIFGTSLTTTNLALYPMQTSFVCNLYKLQSKSHDVDPRRRSWEVGGVIYKNTFVNNLSHLPWVLLIIPPTSHGRPPWINIMWLRLKFA